MGVGIRIGGAAYKAPSSSVSFTETTTWTVPRGIMRINLILVGAGGNGGKRTTASNDHCEAWAGGGGGGGFIARILSVQVRKGQEVAVVVGSGNTTVTINGTTYTANKGGDGNTDWTSGKGGNGQSGGGGGHYAYETSTLNYRNSGGTNGSDGTSGKGGWMQSDRNNQGTGNGEDCYINGVLFSSGGYGGGATARNGGASILPCNAGGANTGNGGDGANSWYDARDGYGKSGGTGFALISW